VIATPYAAKLRIYDMYDMYPWNRPEDDNDEAIDAVQFALDRRDNGGAPSR